MLSSQHPESQPHQAEVSGCLMHSKTYGWCNYCNHITILIMAIQSWSPRVFVDFRRKWSIRSPSRYVLRVWLSTALYFSHMRLTLFLRFFHNPLAWVLDYGILACFTCHKQDSSKIKILSSVEDSGNLCSERDLWEAYHYWVAVTQCGQQGEHTYLV